MSVQKEEEEELKFLLQSLTRTMLKQAFPLQSKEAHSGAEIHLQLTEETHARAAECLRGGCEHVGGLCWSRVMQGPADPQREEPILEQVSGKTCVTLEEPQWRSLFLKDCTPWKGIHLTQFFKTVAPEDSCYRSL